MTTETRRAISKAASALRDPRWSRDAACQYTDPELFFPVGQSKAAQQQASEAKAICMTCPVRTTCLEWATETGEQFGVLGGLTQEERWRLVRVRPRSQGQAMDRCIEARDQIQEWRKARMTQVDMAVALNVDRSVLRAALQRFDRDERKQQELEAAA
ncbi:WhiB family transcriptional regulator [Streptomyces sp. NPDC096351]|uniref:WhiB family transcriptional regulator n=1 Tax=Streptomyces sp. NPDC096351 TaxID=3366087 RepID=UPI0038008CB6